MKGYYQVKSQDRRPKYSKTVKCNHPLFSAYTVFTKGTIGLGVIQQRFNQNFRYSWWGPIDIGLANDIFESEYFSGAFNRYAKEPDENGLYPTIEVRKLMYALKMKPLKKEAWETTLSHKIHTL